MLELINESRQTEGVAKLAWDETAERAGQSHADEMAELGYLSHWNIDGFGPDYRYTRAGGQDYVQENVYAFGRQFSDGTPAPISDWEVLIRRAHANLMESPGHRDNILTPEHTHVGIGMAYNALTGELRIAEEFVNRYATIIPLPLRSRLGERLIMKGILLSGSRNPIVNLAYEPFPETLTLEQLNATRSFSSPAVFMADVPISSEETGKFAAEVAPNGEPGLYHLRLWVDGDDVTQIPSADFVVEMR